MRRRPSLHAVEDVRLSLLEDWAARPDPSLPWLVRPVLPEGAWVLLVGPPKSGKTTLATQLALAVAQGGHWLGYQVVRPVPVLFLQWDMPPVLWAARVRALGAAGCDLRGPVWVPEGLPLSLDLRRPETAAWVREAIEACDPGLVVLDSLREAHAGDEDSSTEMVQVAQVLRRLVGDRSLVLVHHARKLQLDRASDALATARGSSYWTGRVDAVWLLGPQRLQVVSRWAGDRTLALARGPAGLWTRRHERVQEPAELDFE